MKIPRHARNFKELGAILGVNHRTLLYWSYSHQDTPRHKADGRHHVGRWQTWILERAPELGLNVTPLRLETAVTRLRVERVRALAADGARSHVLLREIEAHITEAHAALADKLEGLVQRVGAMMGDEDARGDVKSLLAAEIGEITHFLRHPGTCRKWQRKLTAAVPRYFDMRHVSRTGRRRKRP